MRAKERERKKDGSDLFDHLEAVSVEERDADEDEIGLQR